MGGKAIIVRSFARIHETNLKKQGVLPLTFANPDDYNKVDPDDKVTLKVTDLAPGKPVLMTLTKKDGKKVEVALNHTLNQQQIVWFKAGSALNYIKASEK